MVRNLKENIKKYLNTKIIKTKQNVIQMLSKIILCYPNVIQMLSKTSQLRKKQNPILLFKFKYNYKYNYKYSI